MQTACGGWPELSGQRSLVQQWGVWEPSQLFWLSSHVSDFRLDNYEVIVGRDLSENLDAVMQAACSASLDRDLVLPSEPDLLRYGAFESVRTARRAVRLHAAREAACGFARWSDVSCERCWEPGWIHGKVP